MPVKQLNNEVVLTHSRFAQKPYVHSDYPKVFYHEDGRDFVAKSLEDAAEHCPASEGWTPKPFPRKAMPVVPPDQNLEQLNVTVRKLETRIGELKQLMDQISEEVLSLKDHQEKHKQPVKPPVTVKPATSV